MNWKWVWWIVCLLAVALIFTSTGYFFVFLCAVASTFAFSLAVRRKVAKMMLAKSDVQPANALAESESPEVLSTTKPRFLVSYDFAPTEELVAIRESLIARAQRLFWRTFLRDAIAAAGYCIIPLLVMWIFHTRPDDSYSGLLIGLVVLASLFLRLFFHRNQLLPKNADFEGGAFSDFIFVIVLREFSRPRNLPLIAGVIDVIFFATLLPNHAWSEALGLLLAVAFHCLLVARRLPKAGYNVRVLILRVFGINKNATFTFGRLVQFWEQLGSYYTVVDPSFISYEYRPMSPRITLVFSLSLLMPWAFISAFRFDSPVGSNLDSSLAWHLGIIDFLIAVMAAAVSLLVLVAVEYFRLKRAFVKSGADLQTRLLRLEKNPRRYSDLSFKDMPTMCYDNTWKVAVSAFAKASDVVLMDLRGFSEERKGCAYEVDFLFDTVPVDRVVFLVDGQTDAKLIRQFILDRWERLSATSPNLNLEAPEVRVYLCTEQNERDVQGIFDHLIEAAVSSGRAEAVLGGAITEGAKIKYKNFEDMPASQLRLELQTGTRFVQYEYCISARTTFQRVSRVYLLKPGQSRLLHGVPFSIVTLFLGWWGIPFGPISTVKCLYRNCAGGKDLTGGVALFIASKEDRVKAWTA